MTSWRSRSTWLPHCPCPGLSLLTYAFLIYMHYANQAAISTSVSSRKLVERWHRQETQPVASGADPGSTNQHGDNTTSQGKIPRPPTYFERNLEVWRQLCPPLHFPPSLESYLATRKAKLILVLTKVDIAGPERAEAWTAYLQERHPGLPIVRVEAYQQKLGEQGRPVYESHLPLPFRERLVNAMRQVHEEMLIPPERVRSDEVKLNRWNPP
ncbi:hypothetical protein M405DRAFT_902507, partial [Rhizopogon salebrosus TDB-379]